MESHGSGYVGPVVFALLVVVLVATCAVHGAVGFGMNLLAVPVFIVLDPELVPGPVVALGLVLCIAMVVREGALSWDKDLVWAVGGLVPGTILALLLLQVVDSGALSVVIGALVLLAVGLSLMRIKLSPTRPALVVAGVASGVMATAGGIGGPPLALVYADSGGSKLRSNLAGFFVVTAAASLMGLALTGDFSVHDLTVSLALAPAVVLGFVASAWLRPYVDEGSRIRACVLGLSMVAGITAIVVGLAR